MWRQSHLQPHKEDSRFMSDSEGFWSLRSLFSIEQRAHDFNLVQFLGQVAQPLGVLSSLVSHVTESDPNWGPLKSCASSFCQALPLLWTQLWWGMGLALPCDSVGKQGTEPLVAASSLWGGAGGQGGRKEAGFIKLLMATLLPGSSENLQL